MEQRDVRQWCMLMHLSQFAGCLIPLAVFVVPIVLWQTNKGQVLEIDTQGRMIVSALISFLIEFLCAGPLRLVLIGFPILFGLTTAAIALPIIGATKASEDALWRYRLAFKFL